uniref:Uncharacterized protein n=1 Tax=Arundo donax TaxID=35708 RepID=A0A0A8YMT5_ARUDO
MPISIIDSYKFKLIHN